MSYQAIIRLNWGGSLIMGHCPSPLTLDKVHKKIRKEHYSGLSVRSLGLFDKNTPNYVTYFPNVKARDLKPKTSEFIQPVFRALSEVVVHKNWNPVDFGKPGVLRKSTQLLMGQSVHVDHETGIGDIVGSVAETFWEEAYKSESGVLVPAGINARFLIDGKSHPMIARKIMMNPPAIHSNSVTVNFLWEKSHQGMGHEEFIKNLGKYDKHGTLVRRIASRINAYHETSLVGHGADPFAQKVNENGEINNPGYAAISYNSMKPSEKRKQSVFFFNYKTDTISNKQKTTIPKNLYINNSSSQTTKGMNKLIAFLVATFNLDALDPKNPKHLRALKAAIAEREAAKSLSAKERKELRNLRKQKESFSTGKLRVARLSKFKESIVEKLRKEVLRSYKLISGDDADPKILRMIQKGDYNTLQGLQSSYGKEVKKKFSDSCADCGSHNITRASSKQTEIDDEDSNYPVKSFDKLSEMLDAEETANSFVSMHGDIKPTIKAKNDQENKDEE